MADNKNMALNDNMMAKASGGSGDGGELPFVFTVGDRVTLQTYDQIGIITEAYRFQDWNMYAIHWLEDPYNHEYDSRDVLESNLKYA